MAATCRVARTGQGSGARALVPSIPLVLRAAREPAELPAPPPGTSMLGGASGYVTNAAVLYPQRQAREPVVYQRLSDLRTSGCGHDLRVFRASRSAISPTRIPDRFSRTPRPGGRRRAGSGDAEHAGSTLIFAARWENECGRAMSSQPLSLLCNRATLDPIAL